MDCQNKINKLKKSCRGMRDLALEEPHHLFDFLTTESQHADGLIEALGGLFPEAQGEDYEELDFANKMKRKKKRLGKG
jgi:hypothetical protein